MHGIDGFGFARNCRDDLLCFTHQPAVALASRAVGAFLDAGAGADRAFGPVIAIGAPDDSSTTNAAVILSIANRGHIGRGIVHPSAANAGRNRALTSANKGTHTIPISMDGPIRKIFPTI